MAESVAVGVVMHGPLYVPPACLRTNTRSYDDRDVRDRAPAHVQLQAGRPALCGVRMLADWITWRATRRPLPGQRHAPDLARPIGRGMAPEGPSAMSAGSWGCTATDEPVSC